MNQGKWYMCVNKSRICTTRGHSGNKCTVLCKYSYVKLCICDMACVVPLVALAKTITVAAAAAAAMQYCVVLFSDSHRVEVATQGLDKERR